MFWLAEKIILSSGWRRRVIAFGSGAVGALALAPFDFLPAMIVPMTAAVWLIDGIAEWQTDRPRAAAWRTALAAMLRAAEIGWWWGFGYFVAGLWWLGAAFLVEPAEFAWALPLGVFGLPAYLAFFPALGFGVARLAWAPGASRLLALAGALTGAEWLRGHVLTGFPWNSFGMALGDHLVFAQFAAIGGLYGLNVLTIAIFAAPATFADKPARGKGRPRFALPTALWIAILVLGGTAAYGALRLSLASPGLVPAVKLRIMQPNELQGANFTIENKDAILAHYLSLSDRATGPAHSGLADVTALIWPESAFPFILSRDPQALAQIGNALPSGTSLVTGAARIGEAADAANSTPGRPEFFNSIHVIARGGIILDSYDKIHLVPFGEYMPAERLFERFGLHHFVHVPGGFAPGYARGTLIVPGLPPASPLICYEAIFPGEVMPSASAEGAKPGFMLNVTDDGWFGHTAGPYQHLAQARLRTIEQGLPLVRAATTGLSAVIDPYGRILAELALGEEGVLDSGLPQKIAAPPFARAPFFAGLCGWIAVFLVALVLQRLV